MKQNDHSKYLMVDLCFLGLRTRRTPQRNCRLEGSCLTLKPSKATNACFDSSYGLGGASGAGSPVEVSRTQPSGCREDPGLEG